MLLKGGSSPRLRGTLDQEAAPVFLRRFIPAPAGNTIAATCSASDPPVHPRACGEHARGGADNNVIRGSSPRLRGTPQDRQRHLQTGRFIPAPAGNTSAIVIMSMAVTGSSPRLRGTHLVAVGVIGDDRFIPAPAGNTNSQRRSRTRRTVHPRACGEHPRLEIICSRAVGSSPRLRGTPRRSRLTGRRGRFIPAPAGNTFFGASPANVATVHPRACGEHIPDRPHGPERAGSSPRLRGTRFRHPRRPTRGRFIPAPAGNTREYRAQSPMQSVHPRACGEHCSPCRLRVCSVGSSPRLRGTLDPANTAADHLRFIPAPAGNTAPSRAGDTREPVHPRACGEHT